VKPPARAELSWTIVAICLLALILRAGAAWVQRGDLGQDPDAYLGIAAGLAQGDGFHMPGKTEPTA
jgi:hypothetical protein